MFRLDSPLSDGVAVSTEPVESFHARLPVGLHTGHMIVACINDGEVRCGIYGKDDNRCNAYKDKRVHHPFTHLFRPPISQRCSNSPPLVFLRLRSG